jgi:acetylglutamate kinase
MRGKRVIVVKVGGNVVNDPASLEKFLLSFSKVQELKILVHGGGKLLESLAARLGVEQTMINGRRITDRETMDLATMVYAGLINKSMVAKLQSFGCNAIGLSGADGNTIRTERRPVTAGVDYGYVGDIKPDSINAESISSLIGGGFVPVFSAVTHDNHGALLNTNADTVAFGIATALSTKFDVQLHYCFEKKGVLLDVNDETSLLAEINEQRYRHLAEQKIVSAGMLPKLENAFSAIRNGVSTVAIGHPDELLNSINKHKNAGTYLIA